MSFSWPYQFISLSEEEKVHRRELLDLRGTYAQWSIIAAIIVLRLYQIWATYQGEGDAAAKSRRGPSSWWDRPIIAGWMETRRQYLTSGLWLLWLLSLAVWNSGNDYLHLTKALGHVALSQVPLQVLMSPAAYISTRKPSASSMVSLLASLPQATITPYHRLFGRVVISPLLFGHATLYLLFFVQNDHPEYASLLLKRIRDFDVQCGLLALTTTITLLFYVRPRAAVRRARALAQPPAEPMQDRRRSFYLGHVSLVVVLCAAAFYHVSYAQVYMVQTLGAFVVNGVCSAALVYFGNRK